MRGQTSDIVFTGAYGKLFEANPCKAVADQGGFCPSCWNLMQALIVKKLPSTHSDMLGSHSMPWFDADSGSFAGDEPTMINNTDKSIFILKG